MLHRFGDDVSVFVHERRPRTRGAWVSATGAVGIEHGPLHAWKNSARRDRSTLPPDTIATTFSRALGTTRPVRSAPTAAAPAGSATRRARDARKRTPSTIASSGMTTT